MHIAWHGVKSRNGDVVTNNQSLCMCKMDRLSVCMQVAFVRSTAHGGTQFGLGYILDPSIKGFHDIIGPRSGDRHILCNNSGTSGDGF